MELARAAYEAFNRRDLDAAFEVLDPEIEWHTSPRFIRGGRTFRGHDGVREVLDSFFATFDEFRTEPREFIDGGDKVIVPVRLLGRLRGTGEEMRFDLVQVWTVRDDRAVRLDVFESKAEALKGGSL